MLTAIVKIAPAVIEPASTHTGNAGPFEAIAAVVFLGAALVSAPWHTLSVICLGYLLTIPFSIASYARVRRLRAAGERPRAPEPTPSA